MENLKENGLMHEEQLKMTSYAQLFGSHVPMKLMIERNILGQQRRLPGEKSSLLGRTFINTLKNILKIQINFVKFISRLENPHEQT